MCLENMFTGQTKSIRPATFGILHQVVGCSAAVTSCEDTVVQLDSTAVGDGANLVILNGDLIRSIATDTGCWLKALNKPGAPDTSL